jgi:hypothetical protein
MYLNDDTDEIPEVEKWIKNKKSYC